VKANKDLGQHFLKDQNIILKICSDHPGQSCGILEIGPGPGVLTNRLAKLNRPYHVIEKDSRFEEILNSIITPEQITIGDALDEELTFFDPTWLVSNLPYNVASPLLVKFLKLNNIKFMTLMFQKEVGQRILTTDMNSLGALSQNYFEISTLCQVPPGAFSPPPKVNSIVLSFKRKENPRVPLKQFEAFEKFLRVLFKMRRKQMGNVLKSDFDRDKVIKALSDINIKISERAENLTLENVIDLYERLGKPDGN
jgi:16S rRNA (adenine1518-N6/adenine1519-N6)-dimethyltransferase